MTRTSGHCYYCGRGLTTRTRAPLTPEERLLVAIFGGCGTACCIACWPDLVARLNRKAGRDVL